MKANEQVALATLPKKPKSKKKPTHSETNVVEDRNHRKDISSIYHAHPSRANKNKLSAAKKSLDLVYVDAEITYVNEKINDISNLHINRQHSAAWKTINDLSCKGSNTPTTIKGGNQQKRLENWMSHFHNRLG